MDEWGRGSPLWSGSCPLFRSLYASCMHASNQLALSLSPYLEVGPAFLVVLRVGHAALCWGWVGGWGGGGVDGVGVGVSHTQGMIIMVFFTPFFLARTVRCAFPVCVFTPPMVARVGPSYWHSSSSFEGTMQPCAGRNRR